VANDCQVDLTSFFAARNSPFLSMDVFGTVAQSTVVFLTRIVRIGSLNLIGINGVIEKCVSYYARADGKRFVYGSTNWLMKNG
jgi:hypothetical protein